LVLGKSIDLTKAVPFGMAFFYFKLFSLTFILLVLNDHLIFFCLKENTYEFQE